jgi:ATP-dependent helicase/nuclease subunit A
MDQWCWRTCCASRRSRARDSPVAAGLGEEELFEIAWGRKGSLRSALRAKAHDKPRFAEAAAKLDRFAEWARRDTPFGFYARVLGPERGRRQFLARLGHEANDALDELLNLALDYERRETPSLQGFIAWLRSARTDVKRDMEIGRDEVRVMTVHGAKGLEAPIVILADTITPPAGPALRQPGSSIWRSTARLAISSGPGRRPAMSRRSPPRAARQGGNEDEHRRLLYVAMTRAINRLRCAGRKASVASRAAGGIWSPRPCSRSRTRSRPRTRGCRVALSPYAAGTRADRVGRSSSNARAGAAGLARARRIRRGGVSAAALALARLRRRNGARAHRQSQRPG